MSPAARSLDDGRIAPGADRVTDGPRLHVPPPVCRDGSPDRSGGGDTDRWTSCLADWLAQIERKSGRGNTRRAYEADVRDFQQASGTTPWAADRQTIEHYVRSLAARPAAPATVNRKLAALSSLMAYAEERGLCAGNPFADPDLRDRRTTAQVDFPTSTQVFALLSAINTDRPTGLRNLALIAGMVATTRRINEFLSLRWRDVRDGEVFVYRCKGGDEKRQVMPQSIWRLILDYLDAAGRQPLQPDDFIFVALSDAGERLNPSSGGPLNAGYVARLIRRYGRAAGIPDRCLYPHALRHAGTELRRQNGAGIIDLMPILGHVKMETTLGYLRRLDHPVDPYADAIVALLPAAYRQAR